MIDSGLQIPLIVLTAGILAVACLALLLLARIRRLQDSLAAVQAELRTAAARRPPEDDAAAMALAEAVQAVGRTVAEAAARSERAFQDLHAQTRDAHGDLKERAAQSAGELQKILIEHERFVMGLFAKALADGRPAEPGPAEAIVPPRAEPMGMRPVPTEREAVERIPEPFRRPVPRRTD